MKFTNSLRFKLVIFSILIEISVLTFLIFNADRLIITHLSTQTYKQIESIKENLQASLLPLLIERDYASLDSLLKEYTQSKNISYIFILKDDLIIANANWNTSQPFPQVSTKIYNEQSIYHTTVDIKYANNLYGKVYFGVDTSFFTQAQEELFSQSFSIALAEIILSIILLFSIGYLLTKHLHTLTNAAEKIGQNQFDIDIQINAKDEIGLLAKTFNTMAKQIKEQFSTIQKQNELKKAIFDSMGHILVTTDTKGIITSFNKQAEIILGYKASDLIRKKSIEIIHDNAELQKRAKEFSQELGETIYPNFKVLRIKTDKGLKNQHHWTFVKKDGSKIIAKLTVTALQDEDKKTYGYIGVAEDKTEKYYLEQSLEKETHRVKTILENAGDFIHIVDYQGNLFMYSTSFIKALGYSEEEAKTLNVKAWDPLFEPNTMIDKLLNHPQTFETTHIKKDGSSFDVEVRTNGIILDGKNYIYAASRDITKRKQAQEELRQKDMLLQQQSRLASMGEMIGNIAHQWRQPLSLISTTATSYQLKKALGESIDEEILKDMDQINDATQHLSQTIDDFRNFFRNNDAKEEFSLIKVINDCENITSAAYKNNYITLKKEIVDPNITCLGSSSMLSQVILNILSNAKDILSSQDTSNKVVKITVSQNNNKIVITLKDNAGGVPKEIIDKIFDPYFTTKHQSQGTGIGLYMSSQIIQKHFDGQISIHNKQDDDGFGAEFIIQL